MGGNGSGNWYRWQGKKTTVEDSLTIPMSFFRKRLLHGSSGLLTWKWTSGRENSIRYAVTFGLNGPALMVHYRMNNSEDISLPVRLQAMPMRFGGFRWWFTCPLMVRGIPCNRRVSTLHSPPGSKYFGCRTCHNLTYRSSQEAHSAERAFAQLGYGPDVARAFMKSNLKKYH